MSPAPCRVLEAKAGLAFCRPWREKYHWRQRRFVAAFALFGTGTRTPAAPVTTTDMLESSGEAGSVVRVVQPVFHAGGTLLGQVTAAAQVRRGLALALLVACAGCASVQSTADRYQCWQGCGAELREQGCRTVNTRDSIHVDRRWDRDFGGDEYCILERESCMQSCSAPPVGDIDDLIAPSDIRNRVRPRDVTAPRKRREREPNVVRRCSMLPSCGIAG